MKTVELNNIKKRIERFMQSEEGIGTLEMIMIASVIVLIAVAFRKWIMKWVGDLFNSTNDGVSDFNSESTLPTPAP